MSEYQYYEFHALDQPLSDKAQDDIRSLSRRVTLTSTHAIFVYNYSDFPADPLEILQKYFDAMLHLTNWGSRQLAFRLPRGIVDAAVLAPYCVPEMITTEVTRQHLVLDIAIHEEGGGEWVEGEGWLAALAPLRQDILRGDLRSLYLAWLKATSLDEGDEEQLEPPMPANLQHLSGPLKSLSKFFDIDDDLVTVAAETSAREHDSTDVDLEAAILRLSEQERNAFLVRVARGEPQVDVHLLRTLRERARSLQEAPVSAPPRRTIATLRKAAQERARRRRERQRREAEKARIRKLEALAQQEPQTWEQVFSLIEHKQARAYDEAIKLLIDLRDLARHLGQEEHFTTRIVQIYEDYRTRSGLLSRLRHAGLEV
jgi:hypothetical protein